MDEAYDLIKTAYEFLAPRIFLVLKPIQIFQNKKPNIYLIQSTESNNRLQWSLSTYSQNDESNLSIDT